MNDAKDFMQTVVEKVDSLIGLINLFVPNRHGSIAITRLEEAVMWMNVMAGSYALKDLEPKIEVKDEVVHDV